MDWQGLSQNQFNNQFLFFENYQTINLLRMQKDLQKYFEKVDQDIFNSTWRKEHGYIPDGFKKRTILTIFGAITFRRRTYKYWDQYQYRYVFLADKKLEIEKYSRVTNHLKFKILEQIATGKRQRDIYDSLNQANITTATIGNIIKSFNLSDAVKHLALAQKPIAIKNYLYINMDETYVKLRNNNKMNKYRIRLITFHTGYDENLSTNKRKVLANKRVYWQLFPINQKIETKKFVDNIKTIANIFYTNIANSKIIIGGDGAPWIREVSYYWKKSYYLLDKFHAYRNLKKIFPNQTKTKNLEKYQISKNLFKLGSYPELITYLKTNFPDSNKEQQLKLEKVINYFKNNSLGIINQNLQFNIGVSAEGDVSHIIKWLLGYGSKALNFQTFKNMLLLRTAEINQYDIINYLKFECQNKQKIINEFYQTNYWFKHHYF
ncbi:MAG: UPF0236 family protein [Spiroplasma sp.]|nr:UPF0236 family protein [Spiroplasma sp.]